MKLEGFTPGPWTLEQFPPEGGADVAAVGGTRVASVPAISRPGLSAQAVGLANARLAASRYFESEGL